MTDRPSDSRSFEERRRDAAIDDALAAAVPPAGADFWDRVDMSLHELATDRPPVAEPETPIEVDTGGEVVRLTDMNHSQTNRSSLLLRAAAAVAVLALIGGAFALGSSRVGDNAVDLATDTPEPTVVDGSTVAAVGDPSTTTMPATTVTEPAPTTEGPTTTTEVIAPAGPPCVAGCDVGLPVSSLTSEVVSDVFNEAIGCWFRVDDVDSNGDGFGDFVFFSGDFGAVMIVDGETVTFQHVESSESIGLWTVTDYTGDAFDVGFVDVGEEVETSIESSDRPATLVLPHPDGGILEIPGILGCGV